MVGFEKALGAVKVIKDQLQYRSQSLLNLARGYLTANFEIDHCARNEYKVQRSVDTIQFFEPIISQIKRTS